MMLFAESAIYYTKIAKIDKNAQELIVQFSHDGVIPADIQNMSDFLLGRSFDEKRFVLTAGDEAARAALLRALGTMAAAR